jgi:hypothetical protein
LENKEAHYIFLLSSFRALGAHAKDVYTDIEKLHNTRIKGDLAAPFAAYALFCHNIEDQLKEKTIEAKTVFAQFQELEEQFAKISGIENEIKSLEISSVAGAQAALSYVIIKCDSTTGFLSTVIAPISPGDIDRLDKLRKELTNIAETLDEYYKKNIIEAISEQENGHFLASALIAARVINWIFDQINGQSLENKIQYLRQKEILKGDKGKSGEEEFIIKANKKARNIFSHNIKVFANPSESISLLGDCIRLLRITCPILSCSLKNSKDKEIIE